jgi:hypothetical protein
MTRYFVGRAMLVCGLLVSAAVSVQAVTIRFEAESTGAVKDQGDIAGYDSINGVWPRTFDANASGGEILNSAIGSGGNLNLKVGFVGTGIDLIAGIRPFGDTFKWILDGGTPGQQMGTASNFGAVAADQVAIPIVSGLPKTLHTLEIIHESPQGLSVFVDAFDVHDADTQTRYEMENNAPIVYSPDGNWFRPYPADQSAEEASGGNIGFSLTRGDTATLPFSGTAVSLIVSARPDAASFDWSIDGGAFTGTVNPAASNLLSFGFNHRWPFLLTNSLAPGNHTLTLTPRFGVGFGFGAANFDAIDVYGVPEPGSICLVLIGLVAIGVVRRHRS